MSVNLEEIKQDTLEIIRLKKSLLTYLLPQNK